MNTIIEKIRAEVERLKKENNNIRCDSNKAYCQGYGDAFVDLLSILSDLESETTYDTHQYTPRPSVSIEDVARVQFASHAKVFDKKRKAVFDWEQFKEVAGIFYGFGKKKSLDTLEKEEKPKRVRTLEEEFDGYRPIVVTLDKYVLEGIGIGRHDKVIIKIQRKED